MHQPDKDLLPELQIWRSMDSMIYTKVAFNLITPNKVNNVLNVHQYIPNPPLEFQEGDILGVYQPTDKSSGMELYYQTFDGPANYKLNNNANTANIHALPGRYDYPLVTVEIAAADASFIIPTISSTLVATIPTSTSQTLLTKSAHVQVPLMTQSASNPQQLISSMLVTSISSTSSQSLPTKSLSNSSNSQQVVLPIFAYPVISVAAILIIIAAVITVVMMILHISAGAKQIKIILSTCK